MSLALRLAAHSLLLPQPTCIRARHNTYNGSDHANRMGRLIVCSWGGGVGGKKRKREKDLPIAYDFQFAKR